MLADTSQEQSTINAAAIPVALEANGKATVEGGTVIYDRSGEVVAAPTIARCPDGSRLVANASPELLPELVDRSLVGETIVVSGGEPPTYRLATES